MRVSARLRNLVYRGISRNDNHCSDRVARTLRNPAIGALEGTVPAPRNSTREPRPVRDTHNCPPRDAPQVVRSTMWGIWAGAPCIIGGGSRERGRRRTRQDQISLKAQNQLEALRPPVKLRIMRSAPNEENLFLLPDRFSKERTLLKNDPAV